MNKPIMFVTLALIFTLGVVGIRWIDDTVQRPAPFVHVHTDTLRIFHYDTVTVISRARDTVQIRIKDHGPLTEQDLVPLVCGSNPNYHPEPRGKNHFEHAEQGGIVFCPDGQ